MNHLVRRPTKRYLLAFALLVLQACCCDDESNHSHSDASSHSKVVSRECFTMDLREHSMAGGTLPAMLGFPKSVMWQNESVLFVDSSRDDLAGFAFGGTVGAIKDLSFTEEVAAVVGQSSVVLGDPETLPWFIYPRRNGYMLLARKWPVPDEGSSSKSVRRLPQAYFVNDEGEIERLIGPEDQLSPEGRMVSFDIFRAIPFGEGVFAVGAVFSREGGHEYSPSFFFLDSDTFEPVKLNLRGPETMQDLALNYYFNDFSLIASHSEGNVRVAYVLVMEGLPWIGRVKEGESEITPLTDLSQYGYRVPYIQSAEPLNHARSAEYYYGLYSTIEESAMPLGVYVWNGKLFLLVKSAANRKGSTAWQVREFDGQSLRSPIALPVTSRHIALTANTSNAGFIAAIQIGPVSWKRKESSLADDYIYRFGKPAIMFPFSWIIEPGRMPEGPISCQRLTPFQYELPSHEVF